MSGRNAWTRLAVLMMAGGLLAACQAGEGLPQQASAQGDGWHDVQSGVLETNCVVCHSGPDAPMGLQLTADQYDPIVSNAKPSSELPGYRIVKPTDSTESYIFMKITGDPRIQGERMPRGKPPLPGSSIARVGGWIDSGAPMDRPSGPPVRGPAPPPPGGQPPAPPPGGDTLLPTWQSIQAQIFQTKCVVCHSGPSAPQGLSWEAGMYDAVVTNLRMNAAGTFRIVDPGSKETSFIFLKLMGDPAAGARMPLGGPYLDPVTIATIGEWIDAGAPLGDAAVPPPVEPPPAPPPPPDAGSPVPSWQYIQANVMQARCVMCHSGANPPQGLSWEAGMYDLVVTAQRMDATGSYVIVKPGDRANSYLYMKLTGDPRIAGSRMPLVGGPLAPETIELIGQWIDLGAPLGDPGDADAPPPPEPPPPDYPAGSWLYVQAQVFQVCTMCHTYNPAPPYSSPPKGLVLEPDNYGGVVNDEFIRPYRRDNSKIWERITDPDPDKRMPFGLPPLTQEQLGMVADWIDAGAPETVP